MTTVTERPRSYRTRLFTIADLAALPEELPSGSVKYELDNGRLVPMAPPGGEHGRMQHRLALVLAKAERRKLGEAFSEVGIILRREPDRVVGADAAFVAKRSLPVRLSPEGYLETIPELVVEVRSKNDSDPELGAKAEEYLQAGVRAVWIVDPDSKTVVVYLPKRKPTKLGSRETLSAGRVLPGFRAAISDLFD